MSRHFEISRLRAVAFIAFTPVVFLSAFVLSGLGLYDNAFHFQAFGLDPIADVRDFGLLLFAAGLLTSVVVGIVAIWKRRVAVHGRLAITVCVVAGLFLAIAASFIVEQRSSPKATLSIVVTTAVVSGWLSMIWLSRPRVPVVLTIGATAVAMVLIVPMIARSGQRARQMQTMASIRTLATAIEGYHVAHGRYPAASSIDEILAAVGGFRDVRFSSLSGIDAWGHPFRIHSDVTGYRIVSAARDGKLDGGGNEGYTQNFDDDIVFIDGEFTRSPDGLGRN